MYGMFPPREPDQDKAPKVPKGYTPVFQDSRRKAGFEHKLYFLYVV